MNESESEPGGLVTAQIVEVDEHISYLNRKLDSYENMAGYREGMDDIRDGLERAQTKLNIASELVSSRDLVNMSFEEVREIHSILATAQYYTVLAKITYEEMINGSDN